MAIKPANMDECNEKEKCLYGPNAGLAYTPGDECDNTTFYTFNPDTCDCEAIAEYWTVRLKQDSKYTYRGIGSGFVDCRNVDIVAANTSPARGYSNVPIALLGDFTVSSYMSLDNWNSHASFICTYCVPDDFGQYEACETNEDATLLCDQMATYNAAYGPQSIVGTTGVLNTLQTSGCYWNQISLGGHQDRWYISGRLYWEFTPQP